MFRTVILAFLTIDNILALKYERVELLDNHVCAAGEDAFDVEVVRSVLECVVRCTSHNQCQSLYYQAEQRTCYGCKSRYSTSISLLPQPGTKYMQPVTSCPTGWIGFQDSCYLFGTVSMNIYTAEVWCGDSGAQVVYVDSAAENAFLKSKMATIAGSENRHYIIGIKESVITAGTWFKYGNKTAIVYQDWYENEPSTGSKNCAIFSWQKSYQWDKIDCSMLVCAVCERQ